MIDIYNLSNSADVSVIMTANPNPSACGQMVNFLITISNAGPSAAEKISLDELKLPAIEGIEYSYDDGLTYSAAISEIDKLHAGESITVIARGTVKSAAEAATKNTVTVSSLTSDPVLQNNTFTYESSVEINAVLSLTATAAPNPAPASGDVIYQVTVSNFGPSDAKDVNLIDIFPSELTDVRYSLDNINQLPYNGPINLGTLKSGENLNMSLYATVSPTAVLIKNTIEISSVTPNLYPYYNKAELSTPVRYAADIAIQKTTSSNPVKTGEKLFYSITASNGGPDAATNTVIKDPTPAQLDNMEFSADGGDTWQTWTGTYTLGNLGVNDSVTLLLRGNVNIATGTITNTAGISSDVADPNLHNNEFISFAAVNQSSNLILEQSVSCNKIYAGEQVEYTFTVRNVGPNTAKDVQLSDNIEIVSDIIKPEFSVQGSNVYLPWKDPYTIGDMSVSDIFNLTLRGTVKSSTTAKNIGNSASVTSNEGGDMNPIFSMTSVGFDVQSSADVAVKLQQTAEPAIGQDIGYDVIVTNLGPSDAENVMLINVLPSEILNPQFSVDGGATYIAWVSPYKIGAMAAKSDIKIKIKGNLNPLASGEIVNTATVHSPTFDPYLSNNVSQTRFFASSSADLMVNMKATGKPILGQELGFDVTVANLGTFAALNAELVDLLPSDLLNPLFSVDGGTTYLSWVNPYKIGTLGANDEVKINIKGTLSPLASGEIVNTAAVQSTTYDPDMSNNISQVVLELQASADLMVNMKATGKPILGQELGFDVTVANLGTSAALNAELVDLLPSDLLNPLFSVDGGTTYLSWVNPYKIGTLGANDEVKINIKGTLSPLASGEIVNTAAVQSTTYDPDMSNNISQVVLELQASADLSVVKSAGTEPVYSNGKIAYSVTIVNSGPDSAEEVTLNDILPADLKNAEISADGGSTWTEFSGVYDIGNLNTNKSITLNIKADVNTNSKSITNTATVSSKTSDPDNRNNSSTVTIPILSNADISIEKIINTQFANNHDRIIYTLVITNAGPQTALGVTVKDQLPDALSNAEYSLDYGKTWQDWNGVLKLGNFSNGQRKSVLISATVKACPNTIIQNTATVSSSTTDLNPNNNKASALFSVKNTCC